MTDWLSTALHDCLVNLVTLAVTALVAYATPIVRGYLAHVHLGRAQVVADMLVRAYQQTMAKPDRVANGKAMAMAVLTKRFPHVPPDLLSAAVEAAVGDAKLTATD